MHGGSPGQVGVAQSMPVKPLSQSQMPVERHVPWPLHAGVPGHVGRSHWRPVHPCDQFCQVKTFRRGEWVRDVNPTSLHSVTQTDAQLQSVREQRPCEEHEVAPGHPAATGKFKDGDSTPHVAPLLWRRYTASAFWSFRSGGNAPEQQAHTGAARSCRPHSSTNESLRAPSYAVLRPPRIAMPLRVSRANATAANTAGAAGSAGNTSTVGCHHSACAEPVWCGTKVNGENGSGTKRGRKV